MAATVVINDEPATAPVTTANVMSGDLHAGHDSRTSRSGVDPVVIERYYEALSRGVFLSN